MSQGHRIYTLNHISIPDVPGTSVGDLKIRYMQFKIEFQCPPTGHPIHVVFGVFVVTNSGSCLLTWETLELCYVVWQCRRSFLVLYG